MTARRLIVTGDDFGMNRWVNRGVMRAYREGILRFASLMVTGEAAEEAAALARENPGLGVGLHLDLCRQRPASWGLRTFFLPWRRWGLRRRIAEQIERCLAWGIKPTHLDGHLNVQVHPAVFPVLADLARQYRIPRIRLPRGELGPSLSFGRRGAGSTLVLGGTFEALARCLRSRADGLVVPERVYGLLRSGLMREDYVARLLDTLPPGLSEIYFHPSEEPGSEAVERATLSHQTLTELNTLISPDLRALIEKRRISLVDAREFGA